MTARRPFVRRPAAFAVALAVLVTLVTAAPPSRAISDEDIYNQLRFNFVNPGGRALGMGGAAIAATQDSTASLSNPAALVMLVNDEFFAEYRSLSFDEDDPSFTAGSITAQNGSETLDTESPTYVSYVHQWTQRRGGDFRQWAFAFSRQELVNSERQVRGQQLQFDDAAGQGRFFANTADGDVDLQIVQNNFGFAGQVTANWSIGLTGTYAQFELDSFGASTTEDPFGIFTAANPRERLDADTLAFSTRVDSQSDEDITGSVGVFWQPNSFYGEVTPPLRLGLTYNKGPEFTVPITVLDAAGTPFGEMRMFNLKVPDRYGVGFAYEKLTGPNQENRFTFAGDVVHVAFEDLLDGFENGLNTFTRDGREIAGEEVGIDFSVDDGYELRLGFEWSRLISNNWNFDLRAGAARLPSGVLFAERIFDRSGGGAINADLEAGLRALYAEGDDDTAFSGGISFARVGSGVNVIFDLGALIGDETQEAVASFILRF